MQDGRLFLFCRRLTVLGGILAVIGIAGCAGTGRNPTKVNATQRDAVCEQLEPEFWQCRDRKFDSSTHQPHEYGYR